MTCAYCGIDGLHTEECPTQRLSYRDKKTIEAYGKDTLLSVSCSVGAHHSLDRNHPFHKDCGNFDCECWCHDPSQISPLSRKSNVQLRVQDSSALQYGMEDMYTNKIVTSDGTNTANWEFSGRSMSS